MIKNILSIDSNKFFLKMLSNILLKYDIFLSGFSKFDEAEEFLEKYLDNIDIILLGNVFSDGQTGFELSTILRKKYKFKKPIVMITADFEENTIEEARRSGINLLLPKKIKESELIKQLKMLSSLKNMKKRYKVLVVDDSKFYRERVAFELEGGNYEVITAENGIEGIEKAKKEKPNFIILDVEMPGIDGFETCRRLKAIPELLDIPVIFFSSITDIDAREKGIAVGGVEFFSKNAPLGDMITFLASLREVIENKNRKKAVYIEDSSVQQHVVKHILAKNDIELLLFSDIKKIDEIIKKENIYFILYDLYLPNMSRKESFTFIRKTKEKFPEIPFIVLTSSSEKSDLIDALEAGANDYIIKPFLEEELTLRVKNHIRIKESFDYIVKQNETLKVLSIKDTLTDAYNRTHLDAMFDMFISRYNRKNIPFGAIMLDVDDFKFINDNFGHLTGDEVLKKIVEKFKKSIRPTDFVFRYGGDEFLILLEDINEEGLDTVLKRIDDNFFDFVLNNEEGVFHKISVSKGALLYNGEEKKVFLDKLDKKMYEEKNKFHEKKK